MTISRISDTHTRYLQSLERIAQTKAERIASTRSEDRDPAEEEEKKVTSEREEQKAEKYASQIKEYEREEEEEKSEEDRLVRLERSGVVTPETIRRGDAFREAQEREDDEDTDSIKTGDQKKTEDTKATDDADRVSEDKKSAEKKAEEKEDEEKASEEKEARAEAAEQSLSPQEAYYMLSRNHIDSEFVIEMNTQSRLETEADVLRGERDVDRMRGADTTLKDEQIRDLTGSVNVKPRDLVEDRKNANPTDTRDQNLILADRARQNFQVSIS